MRPKISIVIPVYNVEKYIAECLESCVNQTLREIEIIAIDDGSTDKSLNILKQYSKRYEKLRIIEQDNMGVGVARNNGILASKGEFIAFMDPDDFYYSLEVLEKLYLKAKESGVGICGGSLVELREREGIVYSRNNENPFVFSREGSLEYKDYQFDYGYTRFIYARDFIIQNSIFFPDYKRYQDPPFFIKAMVLASKFYVICDPVYVYRRSHKNIEWTEQKVMDVISGLSDCIELALQYKLDKLYMHILKDYIFSKNFIKEVFKKRCKSFKIQSKIIHMLSLIDYSIIYENNLRYGVKYKMNIFYLGVRFYYILNKLIKFYSGVK